MNFEQVLRAYKNGEFSILQNCEDGLYFLKLKTLSRLELMRKLALNANISIEGLTSNAAFRKLYDSRIPILTLEYTIREVYNERRTIRQANEDNLINELYRLKAFDWGGLHQNNLEKTIINNYVKKITSYDKLNKKIDGDLHHKLRGYTLCSWYNHWTSIIVEDIFKVHKNVLPAVGLVKQIDFFINDTPFDLKVTYLPEGFIKEKRKIDNKRPELTVLKRVARQNKIPYDKNASDKFLLEDLWQKLSDHHSVQCMEIVRNLRQYRNNLVDNIISDPTDLIRWLYENQGTRRFDSSNRFFLVLINKNNYFESWKLKRMRDLLRNEINMYLDSLSDAPGIEISFIFDGKNYQAKSNALVIVKND